MIVRPGADGNRRLTLDIAERMCLIFFAADQYRWHMRVLVVRIAGARWIVCTPTWDIEVVDFADETLVPLRRAAAFPADARPAFVFRPSEATETLLATMRAEARAMGDVLGVQVVAVAANPATDAFWLFADPAEELFNTVVPDGIVGNAEVCTLRESSGLVLLDQGLDDERWTAIEHVKESDRGGWLAEKREGAGRDRRLARVENDGGNATRRPLFREAVAGMDRSAVPDANIFKGPAATVEIVDAVVSSGLEPTGFVSQWVVSSGVPPTSSAAREVTLLIHMLWMLACVDRVNLFALNGVEHIARRILQLQRACRRNPRAPDYEGLSAYMDHAADTTGQIRSTEFDRHISTVLEAEARILKQQRLNREETGYESQRTGGGGGSSSSGGNPNTPLPKAKAKAKAKEGTGDG